MAYPRAPTAAEWITLHGRFPYLVEDTTRVSGPETPGLDPPRYNCIAFAVGRTNTWINQRIPAGGQTAAEAFIEQMAEHGLIPCTEGMAIVDAFSKHGADGPVTHASRHNETEATWESKLGSWIRKLRILHAREGLDDDGDFGEAEYGLRILHFRQQPPQTEKKAIEVTVVLDSGVKDSGPAAATPKTVERLGEVTSSLVSSFGTLTTAFETRFAAWKGTWFSGKMALDSNSSARANGPQWDALVQLGPNVLPFVVAKLKNPADNFAIELYNKLETDRDQKVSPKDLRTYYDLGLQAPKDIQLFGSKLEKFDPLADAWVKHTQGVLLSSSSKDRYSDDSFKALVKMGPGIAPFAMQRYVAGGGAGWWHELLHEVVHGGPSNAETLKSDELFREWKKWYEAPAKELAA